MHNYKIIILDDADNDFRQALSYYKNIKPALAKAFITAVKTAINDLKKNPFYEVRYNDFRLKLVKKYPYIIHYIVNESNTTISIYGIRNTHQDPNTSWFK
jgi:toxin ParE1/3/4